MKLKNRILLTCLFLGSLSHAQVGLDFDGSNDYVNCGTNSSTAITGNALTVEAWVKAGSFGSASTSNAIVNRINNTFQDNDGFALSLGNNGVVTAEIGYGTTTFPYAVQHSTSANEVSLNTWTHVAMTFDGSFLKIYVDGVLSTSTTADYPMTASTQPLAIGYRPQYNQSYFDGIIDEVRVWNTVRTQAEIVQSMNTGACLQSPTGLQAYYSFEQGTPQGGNASQVNLTDDSGNGNSGVLNNFALLGATSNYVGGATVSGDVNYYLLESSCLSYTSPSGQVWTTSGVYYDTLPSATGCGDTVYLINLTVGSGNSSATVVETSCGDYTSNSGVTYTSSGMYTENLQTVGGCDSTLTLDLTILSESSSSLNASACDSYTSPSGQVYLSPGTYTDTIPNTSGCDSIITIDLIFTPAEALVSQNEITLTSVNNGSGYQWVDCDNNYAPISGETAATFTATSNGNYALILTNSDNCSDTSACFSISTIGLEDEELLGVELYPNPNKGTFQLDLGKKVEKIGLTITAVNGKVVYANVFVNTEEINIEQTFERGFYFVTLTREVRKQTLKMIVE
ncbi:Por secretion system C-terminal sorting domain-containing protein [Lishizhenia tianjinensis]|uniref:Por secretion system C-terminal sorting domain-containing protein n=1 Tax=Lishizhenia tianjinensis TaxID=477690 RepID=A0A1I6Y7Q9_9FLAO|nr:LamG-like jellyroll fold domain-containing protein [Lishizhenia tianjinensis]SFT46516.1 Por secretion system C-terminal sorting domain-containing protein [Lishizhenia tianjinensis]